MVAVTAGFVPSLEWQNQFEFCGIRVYTERISSEPEWEFAGIYADRGVSATQMAQRKEFLRMLSDCEKGLIDCVICKSLSRFARNTLDALNCIKKLRELGVRLMRNMLVIY